jgi:hypothetical protein
MESTVMRDTFFVGFDPTLKLWDATPITHTYAPEAWVFKVAARDQHEAILLGLKQYVGMTGPQCEETSKLFQHVGQQVTKVSRLLHELLIVEIPPNLITVAKSASDKGFFNFSGSEEVVVSLASVGWKAIEHHLRGLPGKKHSPESGYSLG